MSGKKKRGVTAGTIFMLIFTATVLISTGYVFTRLNSGQTVDLSALNPEAISSLEELQPESDDGIQISNAATTIVQTVKATETPVPVSGGSITLTFGGTVAVEDAVRKACYSSDSKKYDFYDILTLLQTETKSDYNGAFIENLYMDDVKVTSTVIPANGTDLLTGGGFNLAMVGFSKAWDKGAEGIRGTMSALNRKGILTTGATEETGGKRYRIVEKNGVRVAVAEYTDTMSDSTRKKMNNQGEENAVPDADVSLIQADIASAGQEGADAFIVLLNWGKAGNKTPTKAQQTLAQEIADAGADLIIGAGSRVPQRVDSLTTQDGRNVLCAYSLGTLISDNRDNANRLSGYLLHVSVNKDSGGRVNIGEATYTPTYIWRYRMDSRYYYRTLASDQAAPDGMDSDQTKVMQKALGAVQTALEGSPVTMR